ncbi:ankyrin [Penicillium cataractarum]|uniref:Ankyrin n=1 Tax=Penicillium cataractarum TaxID=2100454 RepID=A0A9W9V0V1_9EURO|nr:ankyrin [Penicillium cataractarum]KAJ5364692.1 ankyrin [Penicillium cataractarum]
MSHHRWDITGVPDPQHCGLKSVLEIAAWKADDFIFKYIYDWASSVQFNWSPKTVARALTLAIFEQKHDYIAELMLLDEGALVVGEHEDEYHKAVELAEEHGHYATARLLKSFKDSVELA